MSFKLRTRAGVVLLHAILAFPKPCQPAIFVLLPAKTIPFLSGPKNQGDTCAICAGPFAWRANARSSYALPISLVAARCRKPRGGGRIAERTLNLGGEAETRCYAYDSAGRLSRVTDGLGGLLESYQYGHDRRRLADINPQRFRGERRYSYRLGNRLRQAGVVQYGNDKAGFRNLKIEGGRETHYHYEPSGLLMRVDLPSGRCIEYAYGAKGQRTEKRIVVNGEKRVVEAYSWLDPLRLSEFHDGREWWRLAYLKGRTPVGVTNGDNS